jgi:hypothetical protein
MSLKTLKYSHAENCKAQKQQQQQQQVVQPKEDHEYYEEHTKDKADQNSDKTICNVIFESV